MPSVPPISVTYFSTYLVVDYVVKGYRVTVVGIKEDGSINLWFRICIGSLWTRDIHM